MTQDLAWLGELDREFYPARGLIAGATCTPAFQLSTRFETNDGYQTGGRFRLFTACVSAFLGNEYCDIKFDGRCRSVVSLAISADIARIYRGGNAGFADATLRFANTFDNLRERFADEGLEVHLTPTPLCGLIRAGQPDAATPSRP